MKHKRFCVPPKEIRRAAFSLRECLFPFGCSLCGGRLADAAESWYGLCADCRAGLEPGLCDPFAACARCGRPLVSERGLCLSCRKAEDGDLGLRDKTVALFPYTGRFRKLLYAYKFGKNLALGNFFAEKTLGLLGSGALPAEALSRAVAVPVPPRRDRMRKTGWDQIGYLARILEAEGLPVSRCLRRLPSESQKGLGRESRMANLKGRIVSARRPPETAVVVDDVMTTGATLDACAVALREGGAKTVFGLCLFCD